ncbi:MAG: DNA primase [Rhodospirillales bacterium]|nr:DNA primase [Rhodospirillales bacterium]
MSLPQGFLDELKARVSLAEVIGKHVRLIRRGRQYQGLCPFHGEKTPSFHVWDDHYHCFGCGAHGSIIDFVMQADKVGFREAVERLAVLAGLALPQPTPQEQAADRRRGRLVDLLGAASRYYCQMLRMPEGRPALSYLQGRGLADAAIDGWRLGFAPDSGQALKSALAREGIDEAALLEVGLLVQPEDGRRGAYDRFRGRVIFPIADQRGRIRGFGGRLMGPGEPKYLNTPETPLFHKGRLLYGIDRAAEAARTAQTIIVVEGYMDVIGLAEAGWRHVVAPLGTALTEDHLRALWSLVPEPVLLFDPDAAGERAALRAAERALPLLKPGFGLRMALLRVDTADDPDRIAARWPKQMLHRTLQEAAPLSDFLFRIENRGRLHVPPEERAAVEARLRQRTGLIADAAVRAHFDRAFRDRLWQAARFRSGKAGRDRSAGASRPQAGRSAIVDESKRVWTAPTDRRTRAELTLCALAAGSPRLLDRHEEDLGRLAFADAALDQLRQLLLVLHATLGDADAATVQEEVRRRGLGSVLDRVIGELPAAPAEQEAEAAWAAEIALLHKLLLKQELAREPAADLSAEAWERRRALIRATLAAEKESG